jgi:tetratricopeptide (TPR) repeat protein
MIIATNEYSQGHTPEAQAMLDQAVSAVSQKAGTDSTELATTLSQVAMYAQGMSDYQRAETDLRRAIAIREKTNGPSDRELSNDLTILGNLCEARGRNQEAMELFQRAISTREVVQHDDPILLSPLEHLAVMYQNMGRNEEAESAFLRLLQLMEGQFGLNSPTLIDPLSKLVSLYHTMGKTASEERTRARLQAIQARTAK